jgi:hypothetical protein
VSAKYKRGRAIEIYARVLQKEKLYALLGVLLVLEHDVDIAYQVVTKVVANIHLLDLPVLLVQFPEDVLRVHTHIHKRMCTYAIAIRRGVRQ